MKLDVATHAANLDTLFALRVLIERTRRQGWHGCELWQRSRGLGQYPTLAELEERGLVPAERVTFDSREYRTRVRLHLPVAPCPVRPGDWRVHPGHAHNARIVSVSYDRGWMGGWRASVYGYGAPADHFYGPHRAFPFVEYETTGAPVYGPALSFELATR